MTTSNPLEKALAVSPNRYWGDRAPEKDKSKFWNVLTSPAPTGGGAVATIRLYGPIDSWGGFWGVSAKDVAFVLDALPATVEQIILRIDSPGGEIFEATTILNMFRAHKAGVLAVIDGQAASAASYLAMGCDETVMSPASTIYFHQPSSIAWGYAEDLRKVADELDVLQQAITDIYSAKAADLDWEAIMAAETRYTGPQAVEAGIVDRVAVIPDAGETITAGADEPEELLVILPDPDEPDDRVSPLRRVARGVLRSFSKPPTAAALGSTTEGKEPAVAFSSDHLKTMRSELGLPEDADEAAIVAAIASRPTATTLPEGVAIVDSATLAQLQDNAAKGVQARAEQLKERRERAVDAAISTGKIAAFQRQTYLDRYEADPEGTQQIIDLFPANTIPVAEIGFDAAGETVNKTAEQDEAYNAYAARFGLTKGA